MVIDFVRLLWLWNQHHIMYSLLILSTICCVLCIIFWYLLCLRPHFYPFVFLFVPLSVSSSQSDVSLVWWKLCDKCIFIALPVTLALFIFIHYHQYKSYNVTQSLHQCYFYVTRLKKRLTFIVPIWRTSFRLIATQNRILVSHKICIPNIPY